MCSIIRYFLLLLHYKAMYLSSLAKYTNDKTRMSFKSSYPVSNVEMSFIFIGAKEQFWTDALPGTTNGPDGIWTHNLLSMIYEHKPLSQGCLAVPENFESLLVLESLKQRRNLMSEICTAVHYQAFQMLIRDLGVLLKSFVKCPPSRLTTSILHSALSMHWAFQVLRRITQWLSKYFFYFFNNSFSIILIVFV